MLSEKLRINAQNFPEAGPTLMPLTALYCLVSGGQGPSELATALGCVKLLAMDFPHSRQLPAGSPNGIGFNWNRNWNRHWQLTN